jgi:hypothetical protein
MLVIVFGGDFWVPKIGTVVVQCVVLVVHGSRAFIIAIAVYVDNPIREFRPCLDCKGPLCNSRLGAV